MMFQAKNMNQTQVLRLANSGTKSKSKNVKSSLRNLITDRRKRCIELSAIEMKFNKLSRESNFSTKKISQNRKNLIESTTPILIKFKEEKQTPVQKIHEFNHEQEIRNSRLMNENEEQDQQQKHNLTMEHTIQQNTTEQILEHQIELMRQYSDYVKQENKLYKMELLSLKRSHKQLQQQIQCMRQLYENKKMKTISCMTEKSWVQKEKEINSLQQKNFNLKEQFQILNSKYKQYFNRKQRQFTDKQKNQMIKKRLQQFDQKNIQTTIISQQKSCQTFIIPKQSQSCQTLFITKQSESCQTFIIMKQSQSCQCSLSLNSNNASQTNQINKITSQCQTDIKVCISTEVMTEINASLIQKMESNAHEHNQLKNKLKLICQQSLFRSLELNQITLDNMCAIFLQIIQSQAKKIAQPLKQQIVKLEESLQKHMKLYTEKKKNYRKLLNEAHNTINKLMDEIKFGKEKSKQNYRVTLHQQRNICGVMNYMLTNQQKMVYPIVI